MNKNIIFGLALLMLVASSASVNAFVVSDRAINVKNNGVVVAQGNLSVYVYDSMSGGTLLNQENFTNAVLNGSWNVLLGKNSYFNLTYSQTYFTDYLVNGIDVNFTNSTGNDVPRKEWQSSSGYVGVSNFTGIIPTSFFNNSYLVFQNNSGYIDNVLLSATNLTDLWWLSNKTTYDASNITSGIFDNARLNTGFVANKNGTGTIINATLRCENITGATSNLCTLVDTSINSTFNITNDTLTVVQQPSALNFSSEFNLTAYGTVLRIFMSFLDATKLNNVSFLNNKITSDAANITTGILSAPRYDTTFVVNKNASGMISNATLYCANISGATSNLCTLTDTNSGGTVTSIATSEGLNRTTISGSGTIAINTTDLNNKITSDAANVTSGTFAQARIPDQSNKITEAPANITVGTFVGNYTFNGTIQFQADASNLTAGTLAQARIPDQSNKSTSDAANITSGVFALARLPQENNTHAADNITAGLFGAGVGNFIFNNFLTVNGTINLTPTTVVTGFNNNIQSDAQNLTSGLILPARENTTFIVNKNGTSSIANATLYCGNITGAASNLCTIASGVLSTLPATNISSGLFGSGIGNNSFNFTNIAVTSNFTLLGTANLSLPVNSVIEFMIANLSANKLFNMTFLNNQTMVSAANVSGGNGSGVFGAGAVNYSYAFDSPLTINGTFNATSNSNFTSLYKMIQSDAANITTGVFALALLPQENNTHTHAADNVTAGLFGGVAGTGTYIFNNYLDLNGTLNVTENLNVTSLNKKIQSDAANLTSGTIPVARYDTTFVVNKNGTGTIANSTLLCQNISGAASNLCTITSGTASTIPAANVSSGLFGSAIGNNSFNFTGLAITSNFTLLGTANLSLPTNSVLDIMVNTLAANKLFNISFLNNLVTLDAANVTSGILAAARFPTINAYNTCSELNAILEPKSVNVTPTTFTNTTALCVTFAAPLNIKVNNMTIRTLSAITGAVQLGIYNQLGTMVFGSGSINTVAGMTTFNNATSVTLSAGQDYEFCVANRNVSAIATYITTGSLGNTLIPRYFNLSAPAGILPATLPAKGSLNTTSGGFACGLVGSW